MNKLKYRVAIPALTLVLLLAGGVMAYQLLTNDSANLGSDNGAQSETDTAGRMQEDAIAEVKNQFKLEGRHYILLTEEQREVIRRIAAKHGATHVRIFGSMARGDAGPQSDLDLLVEKGSETTPWFPAGMIQELEDALGCHVDVVTEKGISPYLREQILREAVPL